MISRENAVVFSLFHQKQTNNPNQVILGHWWVQVQLSPLERPSLSFRGLPRLLRQPADSHKVTGSGQEAPWIKARRQRG